MRVGCTSKTHGWMTQSLSVRVRWHASLADCLRLGMPAAAPFYRLGGQFGRGQAEGLCRRGAGGERYVLHRMERSA